MRAIRFGGIATSSVQFAVIVNVVAACVACAGVAPSECGHVLRGAPLEAGVGFGGLRLGMSAAEVEAAVGPPERTTGDAWEYLSCGFALVFDRERRLAVLMGGGHPTLNERFAVESEEGLGLGSSREDVIGVLGEPTRSSSDGEMLHYDTRGIHWTLSGGRVTHVMIRRSEADPER